MGNRASRAWVALAIAVLLAIATWRLVARDGARAPAARAAMPGARAAPAVAAAVGQSGRPGQRIAGRVTHAGAPVAAAAVRLVHAHSVVAEVASAADGCFDLGVQPALAYEVSAQAAGLAPVVESVDLRAPLPRAAALELELTSCAASVSGTVRDAAGGTIPHARVRTLTPLAVAEADERGAYELCTSPGTFIFEAWADGYAESSQRELVRRRRRLDFALEPETVIAGQVTFAESGAPAADAAVFLMGLGSQMALTRSDGDGRFRFANLVAGPAHLAARLGALAGETNVGHAGTGTTTVKLVLEPRVTLRGRVTAEGRAVAGAIVSARGGGSTGDASTDAEGRFELSHLQPRTVRVHVAGHVVLRPPVIDVATAGDEIPIEVRPRARIRGRVTVDGAPAGFAEVRASQAGNGRIARSGADGRFELLDLEQGTYDVSAEAADRGTLPTSRKVPVGEGQTVDVGLALTRGAEVAGVLIDDNGASLAGAAVQLAPATGGFAGVRGDTSAADGTFAVVGVAAGEHAVTVTFGEVRARARPPGGGAFPALVVPAGASKVDGVRLVVRRDLRRIAGTVVQGGAPAGAVPLALRDPRGQRILARATAAADGRFEFADLEPGSYLVTDHPDWDVPTASVAVEAGREGIVLELPPVGTLEGELVGFDEPPFVVIHGDDQRPPLVADVDEHRFRIAEIPVGRYRVDADTPAASARADATVRARETTRVTLTSSGTARVVGRLVDVRDGAPAAGIPCRWPRVMAHGAIVADHRVSDAGGRFELEIPAATEVSIDCGPFEFVHDAARVRVEPGARGEVELRGVRRRHEDGWRFHCDLDLDPESAGARVERAGDARSGLRGGDVIVTIDGTPAAGLGPHVARAVLCDRLPGETARVTVLREGAQTVLEVSPVSDR